MSFKPESQNFRDFHKKILKGLNSSENSVTRSIFVQRLRSKPWTYKSKFFFSVFFSVFLFLIPYPILFV